MNYITIQQPKKLEIGAGSLAHLVTNLQKRKESAVFILTDQHVKEKVDDAFSQLNKNKKVQVASCGGTEPTFGDFENCVAAAREFNADFVVGIGGGSVLDVAKLVAALCYSQKDIGDFVGNGLIGERPIPLVCVPTTSGAGSESSPNAIMIDESDNSKKGIIDKALVPDEVYIDPELIVSLPPLATAYTGLDALTHCIEAYTNKFAHPVMDTFALEGIRLISQNLGKAIANGDDLDARTAVGLGAYYGGMCLGPVNTAAVHALAYPLGTKYKLAHGLTNALLLPYVIQFNSEVAPERYAQLCEALGVASVSSTSVSAELAVNQIKKLIEECGLKMGLSNYDVTKDSIAGMATDALKIERLLKNNLREVKQQDAEGIYEAAF